MLQQTRSSRLLVVAIVSLLHPGVEEVSSAALLHDNGQQVKSAVFSEQQVGVRRSLAVESL